MTDNMEIPLSEFNEQQRLWCAFLIASATKADGGVDPAEVEFLIKALHFLDPTQKVEVQAYLKTKEILPTLQNVPAGFKKPQLAIIYTELIRIIVSDAKLTRGEKSFLNQVAQWFGFTEEYKDKLLHWGEQMLKAEKYRRKLVEMASQLSDIV